jgi:hypothetical protein
MISQFQKTAVLVLEISDISKNFLCTYKKQHNQKKVTKEAHRIFVLTGFAAIPRRSDHPSIGPT